MVAVYACNIFKFGGCVYVACMHSRMLCVCVCLFVCVHNAQLQLLGHFTVYALEGRGGEVRWHHTPQDFQMQTAYPTVSQQLVVHEGGRGGD